jgi:hypothetical protein
MRARARVCRVRVSNEPDATPPNADVDTKKTLERSSRPKTRSPFASRAQRSATTTRVLLAACRRAAAPQRRGDGSVVVVVI